MAKQLSESQCLILHKWFDPADCCLCKANAKIKELKMCLSWVYRHHQEEIKELKEQHNVVLYGAAGRDVAECNHR